MMSALRKVLSVQGLAVTAAATAAVVLSGAAPASAATLIQSNSYYRDGATCNSSATSTYNSQESWALLKDNKWYRVDHRAWSCRTGDHGFSYLWYWI